MLAHGRRNARHVPLWLRHVTSNEMRPVFLTLRESRIGPRVSASESLFSHSKHEVWRSSLTLPRSSDTIERLMPWVRIDPCSPSVSHLNSRRRSSAGQAHAPSMPAACR